MITPAPIHGRLDGSELAVGAGTLLVLLALLWAAVGLSTLGWFAGVGYAAVGWAVLTVGLHRARRLSLGLADLVTLVRAVLAGGVVALVVDRLPEGAPASPLVALASVALVLDAVDGQLARRTGTVSPLGARFDMEVDALLILALSVQVATSFGGWVLAIGAMRYAFVAASWAAPWLKAELPASLGRKTVAALQGIVLVVACSGVLPRSVAAVSLVLALLLLGWSFGRDVIWLYRRHRVRTCRAGSPGPVVVPEPRPSVRPPSRRAS